jgi:hypothetical protein
LQAALLAAVREALGTDPFGQAVRVVTSPPATLQWEMEILRAIGGGSLRLRILTPARLAADLLAAAGEPRQPLSHRQIRSLARLAAVRQGSLAALGEGLTLRPGVAALLADTLLEAWWQAPTITPELTDILGPEMHLALRAAMAEVAALAAGAGLAPEPLLLWRAARVIDTVPLPPRSVFWPEAPLRPAEAALRDGLMRLGALAETPPPAQAPQAGVAIELRQAEDMRSEVRSAARRCLELVQTGVAPQDILVGLGDFSRQRDLMRTALAEAGIAADAGPEPATGGPAHLCLTGILDLMQGGAQGGWLSLAASGLLPAPGRLRDDLVGHLRDGAPASQDVARFMAEVRDTLDGWPREAPLAVHRMRLEGLLQGAEVAGRLAAPELETQVAVLQSFREQIDTLADICGDMALSRHVAAAMLADALSAAGPDYRPSQHSVRLAPLQQMQGLEAAHVLLLGAVEGAFPRLAPPASLLARQTLARCEAAGHPLAEPYERRRARALADVFAALAAARRTLYLSYAALDLDGGVQSPAVAAGRLGAWLPARADVPLARALAALSRQEAAEILAEAAGRARDIGIAWSRVKETLDAYGEVWGPGPHLAGLGQPGVPDRGPRTRGPFTVTARERRAAGQFTAFAHDVLRVGPMRHQGFDAATRGALVHHVLRLLPLAAPPPAEQAAVVAQLVAQAARELGEIWPDSERGRSLQAELAREMLRTARLVWEEARRTEFETAGREVAFGREGALPALGLHAADGGEVLVEGRIDRLDSLRGRLRVVDYKVRRRQEFSFARVFHGLDLQIGAYALAAAQTGGEPVAMAYWPVRLGQSWVDDEQDDDPEAEWRAQRPKGLFLADPALLAELDREAPRGGSPFHPLRQRKDGNLQASAWALPRPRWQALLHRVERRLVELATEAEQGEWAPTPFRLARDTACDGCGLRPACRHVPGRDGYRRLETVRQEVLDDVLPDS